MTRRVKILMGVLPILIVCAAASAFAAGTLQFFDAMDGSTKAPLWIVEDELGDPIPVPWYINDQGVPTADPDAGLAAVDTAFDSWQELASTTITFAFQGSTPTATTGLDFENVITFADQEIFEFDLPPGVLAFTASFHLRADLDITDAADPDADLDGDGTPDLAPGFYPSGMMIDADISFSPLLSWETSGATDSFDVEAVAVHEIGHFIGLAHTLIEAATMFPYISADVLEMRSLHTDDIASAAGLYPGDTSGFGSISGTITNGDDSSPTFGAFVVAVDTTTGEPAVGVFSGHVEATSVDPVFGFPAGINILNGDYTIPGLTPGDYTVTVVPLGGGLFQHPFSDSHALGETPVFSGQISEVLFLAALEGQVSIFFPPESYSVPESNNDDPAAADIVSVTAATDQSGIDIITNEQLPVNPTYWVADFGDELLHDFDLDGDGFYDPLGDDDNIWVDLGFGFPFYGGINHYVSVGSNGHLTFGQPDTDYTESVDELLAGPPRIATVWDDFYPPYPYPDPGVAQGVFVNRQTPGQITFTWSDLPDWNEEYIVLEGRNTFQVTLWADGRIAFGYQGNRLTTRDGLVGVAPGWDPATQANAVDFSAIPAGTGLTGLTGAIFESFDPRGLNADPSDDNEVDLEAMNLFFQPTTANGFDVFLEVDGTPVPFGITRPQAGQNLYVAQDGTFDVPVEGFINDPAITGVSVSVFDDQEALVVGPVDATLNATGDGFAATLDFSGVPNGNYTIVATGLDASVQPVTTAEVGVVVTTGVFVSASDEIGLPGQPVTVAIDVESDLTGLEVYSYDFRLFYDSSLLIFAGAEPAGTLSEGAMMEINTPNPGEVGVYVASAQALQGTGTLIELTFYVYESAPLGAASGLFFGEFRFNEGFPLAAWTNGSVTVPAILLGDVSFNGEVTAFDASITLRAAAELVVLDPMEKLAADVTGNGEVTAFDAAQILRFAAGLIPEFPERAKRLAGSSPAGAVFILEPVRAEAGRSFTWPIRLSNARGVEAAQWVLSYDPAVLEVVDVIKTGWTRDYELVYHKQPGQVQVALAGIEPLSGAGELVQIAFQVVGTRGTTSPLEVSSIQLNETPVEALAARFKEGAPVPTAFRLGHNYPNPFNPETEIPYELPEAGRVRLAIYNLLGQQVRLLLDEHRPAGYHRIRWDGLDNLSRPVSSGIYFYRLEVKGRFSETKRMLLLK